ncbi:gephyrin-like molybdotransferase receptor GlpR [Nocardia sp. NPDC005366]|uniref:divisome protein SepX/GlpR n=1 Tax=Nocardia sp. NPDC005366 TaxID=3156878 RepID=UPI0033A0D74B
MPNSILWIGLVVLWVFVLFPILADRHPRIRQTTDAALATRVLHRGGSKRRPRKGPAAGHHDSDPDYRPTRVHRKLSHSDDAEDRMNAPADELVTEADTEQRYVPELEAGEYPPDTTAAEADIADAPLAARIADVEIADADFDDQDFADDSAGAELAADFADGDDGMLETRSEDIDSDEITDAPPRSAANTGEPADDDDVADEYPEPTAARIPPARSPAQAHDPEYQSGEPEFVPSRRGRGGYDPEADAIARAARYTFRQRAVLGLVLAALLSGASGIVFDPRLWSACGLSIVILVTYLAYLRKQVRMEEDIRRRRAARLTRGQHSGEDADSEEESRHAEQQARRAMDRETARALRRRSVLLEPDDEDPAFVDLDHFDPATARALRRGTSAEIRRAAGA